MSASGQTIVQRLSAVSADVGAVRKTERNVQQKFSFRGIDTVVSAVHPVLVRHEVIVYPEIHTVDRGTAATSKGGTINTVWLTCSYHFRGPDGDEIVSSVAAEAFDSGDKATAKAMSVAFRTALLQVLTLPTDEPDPDSESHDAQPLSADERARAEGAVTHIARIVAQTEIGAQRDDALGDLWRSLGPRLRSLTVTPPPTWGLDGTGTLANLIAAARGLDSAEAAETLDVIAHEDES